jgi:hypothetical protein
MCSGFEIKTFCTNNVPTREAGTIIALCFGANIKKKSEEEGNSRKIRANS